MRAAYFVYDESVERLAQAEMAVEKARLELERITLLLPENRPRLALYRHELAKALIALRKARSRHARSRRMLFQFPDSAVDAGAA